MIVDDDQTSHEDPSIPRICECRHYETVNVVVLRSAVKCAYDIHDQVGSTCPHCRTPTLPTRFPFTSEYRRTRQPHSRRRHHSQSISHHRSITTVGFLDRHGKNNGRVALQCGRLEVIIGPMFSGKTTELMQRIEVDEVAGLNVLAVKSELDNRFAKTENHQSYIVSHSGGKKECISIPRLSLLKAHFSEDYHRAEVIAVDEAQFFPDLLGFCEKAVDADGKIVYVAGLDGDFRRRPFKLNDKKASAMMQIIPFADVVSKRHARCYYCKEAAPFTLRTVSNESEVLVGGADLYVPVCRRHYLIKWKETHSDNTENTPDT